MLTKGPVCGVDNCRSRLWDEDDNGVFICQNGHIRGEARRVQDDDDYVAVRPSKKKRKEETEKLYQTFQGAQALDLYLKSIQLILRRQLWFLIQGKGLPAELETIVLDLWSLRILQLEERIADAHGDEPQSQTFSATEAESEDDTETFGSRQRRGTKLKSTPSLNDCLALCYLGILTLRLPVTPGDIHAWITDGQLVYKRALKHLPLVMRSRLPNYYHNTLEPNVILKYERFYSNVIDLAASFKEEYGIVWPTLNHPLLLFRYLKDLALPLELYDATIRLARHLEYDFALPVDGQGMHSVRQIPECQITACLLVCVKLMYPFDGLKRSPKTTSEPAAASIDWDEWYKQISSLKQRNQGGLEQYTAEELMNLHERDVFKMSGNQLDQYLDWYQDSFIEDVLPVQDQFRTELYRLFPIDQNPNSSSNNASSGPGHKEKLEVVKAVHSSLLPQLAIPEGNEEPDTVRPGEKYKYYKKVEDLPERARRFYEEAAKVAGLSMDMLVMAVFFAEKKIEKRMVEWRRQLALERE